MRVSRSFAVLLVLTLLSLGQKANLHAEEGGGGMSLAAPSSSASSATGMQQSPLVAPSALSAPPESVSEVLADGASATAQQQVAASAPTPFQAFVSASTGQQLAVYGRSFFRKVPSTFAPLNQVQVNPEYVIGPGDVIQVRAWGMIDIALDAPVKRDGTIYLPSIGQIAVSGVKFRNLESHLKEAVSKVFANFELSASIARTRSVQIYVTGHAQRPGTYNLSAMSTLLNALFASGGPSATGTMRNVEVKRGGKGIISFDLYKVLLYGDTSGDIGLQDGDVIFIPPVGPQVALLGDVKNPAIYELATSASVADLVTWSGGFESAAELKRVIVEKSSGAAFQTVAELQASWDDVSSRLSTLPVAPTEIIRVFAPGAVPIEVKIERAFVRVDGAVNQSGVIELRKGETLKSLMERVGGISDYGYLYGMKLMRESVRREQQSKIDEAVDRFEQELEASVKQRIAAGVDPGTVSLEAASQRRLVGKLRNVKADGRIILNLKDADAVVADLPELPLLDGDRIYVPQRPMTVDVIGAVYQQNTFIFQEDRSVSNYLALAGGTTRTADRGEVYRICADGTVKSRRHSGGGDINPGDAIVVPEKLTRGQSFLASLKDWTTVLYQLGLGAAGLNALK